MYMIMYIIVHEIQEPSEIQMLGIWHSSLCFSAPIIINLLLLSIFESSVSYLKTFLSKVKSSLNLKILSK